MAGLLCVLFDKSLVDGKYPERFKLSQVTPIYKDGKKSDVSNYRGVAIMPNLAKVFERIINNQLTMIIAPRISKQQHGFVSNRCIETNLMEFVHYIHSAFEQKVQVDVFFADIKKAFDTVSQPLMVRKVSSFPLSNQTLHWLNSYSSNRKQCVKVGSSQSEQYIAHSAIGQGTILGPLIFISYFDDLDADNGPSKSFNFADDKKKAMKIRCMADTVIFQEEIDKFVRWCDQNGLELNVKKCKIMSFSQKRDTIKASYSIKGVQIERVDEIRDLGVIMDPKLSFHPQIEFAKRKADNCLAFVKRECYKTLKLDNAKLLYGSLVRSHLEFANVIWSPYHSSHKRFIESTQKQAVIFINKDNLNREENGYVLKPYVERCDELNITSLIRRRINSAVLWMHKIISGRMDSPELRSHLELNTGVRTYRNPEFIKIKFSRTEYGLNSPFNVACRAFNHAALFIDPTLPFHDFKDKVIRLPDSAFGNLVKL